MPQEKVRSLLSRLSASRPILGDRVTNPPPSLGFKAGHAIFLLLLALALRWGFHLQNGALLLPDSWGRYLPVAEGLFGQWRGTVFDTPGYPAFLATAHWLGGGWQGVFWLQGLLDALNAAMVYAIGARLLPPRWAFFCALFFALHAGGILFANSILSETLFSFLILGAVFCFSRLDVDSGWYRFAAPGLLLGLAAVTRANGVLSLLTAAAVLALCRLQRGSLKPLACLLITALLPIGAWRSYNQYYQGVPALAQGGGWQWLQNMAYFELIEPESLPPEEAPYYEDWRSLSAMRVRLLEDPTREKTSVDRLCGQIARGNAFARPFAYLARLPSAFTLPRRFIKDITRLPTRPDLWRQSAAEAGENGYPGLSRESESAGPFHLFYKLLRILTIIPYKYSLLVLCLFPAAFFAWRGRNGLLLLVAALPLSQFLVLTALLNPIERYFFPFEPMMALAALATLHHFKAPARTPNAPAVTNF